jgi:hypothetical protein
MVSVPIFLAGIGCLDWSCGKGALMLLGFVADDVAAHQVVDDVEVVVVEAHDQNITPTRYADAFYPLGGGDYFIVQNTGADGHGRGCYFIAGEHYCEAASHAFAYNVLPSFACWDEPAGKTCSVQFYEGSFVQYLLIWSQGRLFHDWIEFAEASGGSER